MLTRILHRLVAHPRIYDLVQYLAGSSVTRRHIAAQCALLPTARTILDVGGGTGILRDLWPSACDYICLDQDIVKLQGFLRKYPGEKAVLGDATQTPIKSGSMDVVLCSLVSHHIPDDRIELLIAESIRVLANGGRFIFVDAVWKPKRYLSRLLWHFDRGSHPRTEETLHTIVSKHGEVLHWQNFAVFHTYILCVVTPHVSQSFAQMNASG